MSFPKNKIIPLSNLNLIKFPKQNISLPFCLKLSASIK